MCLVIDSSFLYCPNLITGGTGTQHTETSSHGPGGNWARGRVGHCLHASYQRYGSLSPTQKESMLDTRMLM